jgi:SAM-dependent methyltransferase
VTEVSGNDSSVCLLCGEPAARVLYEIEDLPLYLHAVAPELQAEIPRLRFRAGACDCCGHLQQISIPPPSVVEPVYTRLFETYQSTAKTGIGSLRAKRFLDFLARHVPLHGSVLEVGCFDGHFLSLLRDRGCEVLGCDPSAGAKIASEDLRIDVRREFFRSGLFPHSSFDLFVARQLLEHIERPTEFMAAARQVLRPSGLLAIEVPDAHLWLSSGVLGSLFHEHVSYYTASTLRRLIEAAGFDVVGIEHQHTDLFLVARNTQRPRSSVAELSGSADVEASRELLLSYDRNTFDKQQAIKRVLAQTHEEGGLVTLYGAGVHSSSMVAALGLNTSHVDRIVDDNSTVQGQVLPNLPLTIRPSEILLELTPWDVTVISGFSFQEEMLARLKGLPIPIRTLMLYPAVTLLEHALVTRPAARPVRRPGG